MNENNIFIIYDIVYEISNYFNFIELSKLSCVNVIFHEIYKNHNCSKYITFLNKYQDKFKNIYDTYEENISYINRLKFGKVLLERKNQTNIIKNNLQNYINLGIDMEYIIILALYIKYPIPTLGVVSYNFINKILINGFNKTCIPLFYIETVICGIQTYRFIDNEKEEHNIFSTGDILVWDFNKNKYKTFAIDPMGSYEIEYLKYIYGITNNIDEYFHYKYGYYLKKEPYSFDRSICKLLKFIENELKDVNAKDKSFLYSPDDDLPCSPQIRRKRIDLRQNN